MKTIKMVVLILMVGFGTSSCGAFESESLYRDPQASEANADTQVGEDQPAATVFQEPVELAVDQSPVPDAFTLVVPHPDQGDFGEVLAAHARAAADLGRRPFVEFSAEWCPPCRAIEASLDNPLMVDALQGVYLIRIDIDEWEEQLVRSEFRIPGIPLFYELDSNGRSTGRAIAGSAWGEDIPTNMAPPLHDFFQEYQ